MRVVKLTFGKLKKSVKYTFLLIRVHIDFRMAVKQFASCNGFCHEDKCIFIAHLYCKINL